MPLPPEYFRPKTRPEAIELLRQPKLRMAPLVVHPKPQDPRKMGVDAYVDLGLLGLDGIQATPDGTIHIGALVTLQGMMDAPILQTGAPALLSQAAGLVATPGVRNLSSLWGAIEARSGPPEVVLALLALDARLTLLGKGDRQRTLSMAEFLEAGASRIQPGELVLEACLPPFGAQCGWALERVARTPRDEAIVAAAAVMEVKQGKVTRLTLALAGAGPQPHRLPSVEELLTGKALDAKSLSAVREVVGDEAASLDDFRGGAGYRRVMSALVVSRALSHAWEQALARSSGGKGRRE